MARRLALAMTVSALLTGAAAAAWAATTSGNAAAKAGTLAAGSKPTAAKSGIVVITVTLSWTPTTGATGYVIHRTGGVGSLGGTCTGTVAATTCQDTPVVTLQTYTYTVTPVRGTWAGAESAGTSITT
jgi:hypothetical protein